MLIVLYSDAHAIVQAAVELECQLESLSPDAVWFLGDIVGRGISPHLTAEIVCNLEAQYSGVSILGNHDMSALGRLSSDVMVINGIELSESGFSVEQIEQHHIHAQAIIQERPDVWTWMSNLPLTAMPLPGYLLAHGMYAPEDEQRMVWNYATRHNGLRKEQFQIARQHSPIPPRLIALGHIHRPGLWQQHGDSVHEFDLWAEEWIELRDLTNAPALLNTGTISLPREDGIHAGYVLLDVDDDLDRVRVGFRHLPFDWRPLIKQIWDGYLNADEMRKSIRRNLLPPGIKPPTGGIS